MKRFQSRLQSLQRLREQQEQLARVQVADRQQALQRADQQQATVEQQLRQTSTDVNQLMRQQPGAETMAGSLALYRRLQQDLTLAQQARQQAAVEVDQALAAWNDARSELKAISNRIDSQRAEHRRNGFLQEEHAQQETSAQAFFRRATETEGVTKS